MAKALGTIDSKSTVPRSILSFANRVYGAVAGRVDFDPKLYDRLIEEKGYTVILERAVRCPCIKIGRDGHTGQPRADCDCDYGYRYKNPEEIRGIISEITADQIYTRPQGEFALGDIRFTARPIHPLAYMDRLTMKHSRARFTEPLIRGSTVRDKARYPIIGIISVITETTDFVCDKDFRIVEGEIDWSIAPSPPVAEDQYSIAYFYHPIYRVVDLPHNFRDTQVAFRRANAQFEPMPVQAVARLDFLI